MVMLKMFHCYNCIEKLKETGQGAVDLYLQLCELYIANDQTLMLDIDKDSHRSSRTIIQFLEVKGYIVTTDASDIDQKIIKVKPTGHTIKGEDLHMFCPLGCDKETS